MASPGPVNSGRFHLRGWLICAILGLTALGSFGQTPEVKRHSIRVAMETGYAPYSFRSDDGTLQGIVVDQWRAWEKKTGIKVEIRAMEWGEVVPRMRAGEFDVIGCIVETEARQEFMDFSPPFATIEAPIFFRRQISGITDLGSLKGFPIGVKIGDQRVNIFTAKGLAPLIPFQSHEEMVRAAKERKINVFIIDRPSAAYFLHKAGIENEFFQSDPVFRDDLRRAVRKGDTATMRLVMEGFAAVGSEELKRIDEKWFGRTINRYHDYLIYAGYVGGAALLLIAALIGWNRTLHHGIRRRTAALAESEHRLRETAETLQHSKEQLHELVRQLHNVREEEAKRIARELHDDLGQRLTALNMEISNLETNLDSTTPALRGQIARMRASVDQTVEVVQSISSELRLGQLDILGLTAAIEWQVGEFAQRSGIACKMGRLDEITNYSDAQRTAVFRVLQEALTNVARHAHATEVEVSLQDESEQLALTVRDNGRGITPGELSDRKSIGLLGMRERVQSVGGEIEITGAPGRGTAVRVKIAAARPARVFA